jgi:deoxyribose-phosphate aldolase
MNPTEHVVERPQPATYEDLARRIDHHLLRPDLTDDELHDGCLLAVQYGVAAVIVRPADVEQAVRWAGSVTVGTVVGFPHGGATTAVKVYETNDALRRGAKEIDAVLNLGKLRARQFQYVEVELMQLAEICHRSGAKVKAIFETGYLADDLKVIASRIAKRCGVDFVQNATGFGRRAAAPGEDLRLLFRYASERYGLKAAGGIDTLEAALAAYASGADRLGTSATEALLEEWKRTLEAAGGGKAAPPVIS